MLTLGFWPADNIKNDFLKGDLKYKYLYKIGSLFPHAEFSAQNTLISRKQILPSDITKLVQHGKENTYHVVFLSEEIFHVQWLSLHFGFKYFVNIMTSLHLSIW